MWLSKFKISTCYTHSGGGPVTNIPINSRHSGNRRVNLEGLGVGGGNESIKGSIVPSSPHPITLGLTLFTTSYPLVWNTVGLGRGGKGQVPTMVTCIRKLPQGSTLTFNPPRSNTTLSSCLRPLMATKARFDIHLSGGNLGWKMFARQLWL